MQIFWEFPAMDIGYVFRLHNTSCACVFILPPLNQLWSNLRWLHGNNCIQKSMSMILFVCIIFPVYIHFHSIPTNMSCHYYPWFSWWDSCRVMSIPWHHLTPLRRCFGYDWRVQISYSQEVFGCRGKTCKPSISKIQTSIGFGGFGGWMWMINLGTEALLAYSPRERDSNQEEWHATSQANGGFYSARFQWEELTCIR